MLSKHIKTLLPRTPARSFCATNYNSIEKKYEYSESASHERITNRPFTKRSAFLAESFSSIPRTEAPSVQNKKLALDKLDRLERIHQLPDDNEISHKIIKRRALQIKPSESETEISLKKIVAYRRMLEESDKDKNKLRKAHSFEAGSQSE